MSKFKNHVDDDESDDEDYDLAKDESGSSSLESFDSDISYDDVNNDDDDDNLDDNDDTMLTKLKKRRTFISYKFDGRCKKKIASKSICTRQTKEKFNSEINGRQYQEQGKDIIESDEDEKSRGEALWADFLKDVNPITSNKSQSTNCSDELQVAALKVINNEKNEFDNLTDKSETDTGSANSIVQAKIYSKDIGSVPAVEGINPTKKVDITLTKETHSNVTTAVASKEPPMTVTAEEKTITTKSESQTPDTQLPVLQRLPVKRTASSRINGNSNAYKSPSMTGLGCILNTIGKKKKLSVLEETKLDWNTFKHNEGIEDELRMHNRGRDGYLERQDFLQRTNLRQFEIEKSLRLSKN